MIASCIAPKLSVECGSLDGKSIYQLADNLSFQEPTQAGHRDDHFAVEVEDGRSSIRGQCEIPGPVEPNRVKLGLVTKLTGTRRSVNPHVLQPCKGGGAGQTTENVQLITRDDVTESEYGPLSILMGIEHFGLTDVRKLKRSVEVRISQETGDRVHRPPEPFLGVKPH